MGNTVMPRMMYRGEAGTARGRRPKSFVTEASAAPDAAPRRLTATLRKQRDGVELEQQDKTTRAGPGRSRARARGISWAGGAGSDDAAAGKASAAAVVTVKIVLKRKDAEALVARLNVQSERERKARMAELRGEFRAGDCVGGASPRPCRDAWKPSLVPIREKVCPQQVL